MVRQNNLPNIITQKNKIASIMQSFHDKLGYSFDVNNPKTFNEKIQWLKLFYRNNTVTKCADKYEVRSYIERKIGTEYLIDLVGKGIYSSVEELDFHSLPDRFVLKTTDGWKTNIICTDKDKLDIEETKRQLESWLCKGNSHYYIHFEWAYKNIKPRIICEDLIEQEGGLVDYKLWCFNGKVQVIQVCSDRGIDEQKNDYFDTDWQRLDFKRKSPNSNKSIAPPGSLKLMIDISEKLSAEFPFVRIDLYEIDEKIRFGEMTFYPANGISPFEPPEWDEKFGEMLQLPKKSFVFPFELNKRKLGSRK